MIIDITFVVAGLVLLVFAGDFLVKGAVNLALRLGIPALVVGLTVVAFGTSAPELLVSVTAVLNHVPDIALGNVVGSNTANILLVLGLPALMATIQTKGQNLRESLYFMLAATVLFILLCLGGVIAWPQALVLLAGLGLILWRQISQAMAHRRTRTQEELEGAEEGISGGRIALLLLAGLIGLPIGAQLLIEGASDIARAFGISDTVIGLTLVAVGTSLPELATSISAARKGQADVALGNVIGSNIFNLLCIIGVAGLVGPLPIPPSMLRIDLWVMLGAALLITPMILRERPFSRPVGLAFVAIYIAYTVFLVLSGKV